MSVFEGLPELVDSWLDVAPKGRKTYYQHRAAWHQVAERDQAPAASDAFLTACYERIDSNWKKYSGASSTRPSRQNWRWKRHIRLSTRNTSPEVILEREIVAALGNDWSNQMPVASGLAGPSVGKRAVVDLVKRSGDAYLFIELKVGSDTPLFAAIEILLYGVLFQWSKDNQHLLGYDAEDQPVLSAQEVSLIVLAPAAFYRNRSLTCLTDALNEGLKLQKDWNLKRFGFETFTGVNQLDARFRNG